MNGCVDVCTRFNRCTKFDIFTNYYFFKEKRMTFHKNIFKHVLKCALILGFVTFAFSCNNPTSPASVSKKDDKTRTLNLEITNYNDVVAEAQKSSAKRSAVAQNGARTIIPTTFDSDGVKFYLYGTATNKKTFGPKEVTFTGTSKTVGKIAISADAFVWEFTLAALENTAAAPADFTEMIASAVLIGHSSMDMSNGNTAKFTLSPDGLTKEASIGMKLYLDGWTDIPTGYNATAGIYKLTDGSVVNDKDGNTTVQTIFADIATFPTMAPTDANYSVAKMDPGTYLFKVTFTNATTKKKFIWSDVLVVLPGKPVDNEVAITNVIGVKPDEPTDFKAGFVASSEDRYNGMYVTEFTWARGTSNNENYFEIDLLELADATATVQNDDTSWVAAVTAGGINKTYGADFSSSDIHESGSLLSGNTNVQVCLSLGKRYFARIRALNDAGNSDYTYVTLDGTEAFTSDTINRYRITYHLNEGVFNGTVGTENLTNKTDDIVLYYCQDGTNGNDIIVPDGTDPTLIYTPESTDYSWTSWKTSDNTNYDATVNADYPKYKDYKNLDLYASYETPASVEIFDKSAYDIKIGWISVDGTALTQNTTTIDASAAQSAWTFEPTGINDPSGAPINDFTYDSVVFNVSKGGKTYYGDTKTNVKVDETATFNMPLDNLAPGVYNVQFMAHKGKNTVSCTISVTITR